jgi:REP element-mobilizing transposase RayT
MGRNKASPGNGWNAMAYDPKKHHRRSIRLQGYDYDQAGAYFITICVNFGQCYLGEVRDGVMFPSLAGEMVADCWYDLLQRFPNIDLDTFSLMPNHVHGILVIEEAGVNANNNPVVLGDMVGAFKSISTSKYIKGVEEQSWPPFYKRFWQRGFYEHIIRNERALTAIREYIINNPANWVEDKLHPMAPPNKFNKLWQRPPIDDHIDQM